MSETLYEFLERRERELSATAEHHRTCLDAVESELEHVRVCRLAVGVPVEERVQVAPPEPEMHGVNLRADLSALPQSVREPEREPEEEEDDDDEEELPGDKVLADASGSGLLPDLLMRLLPAWMEKFPYGPTILNVAAETRLPASDIRQAFRDIQSRQLASVYQGKKPPALHLVPLNFRLPEEKELSPNQEKVLGYLSTLPKEKGGTVTPLSSEAVHDATGVPTGSLGAAISDLERKGFIEVTQRGVGSVQKPRYRVLKGHRQVLQQALADRPAVRDATASLMGDPPPMRSALAEKLGS